MDLQLEIRAMATLEDALEANPDDLRAWLKGQDTPEDVRRAVTELWAAHHQASTFLSSPRMQAVPERLGPYQLLELISEGGMGSVYLARRADDAYEQLVAIKFIRLDYGVGADTLRTNLIQRFEAEREILARLNHPHIARIVDGGQTQDGQPYLIMEYVEGRVLSAFVKAARPPLESLLGLMIKVCSGVQEAHRNLIVHRDLKPANILVSDKGEPKLLDFGIAKILSNDPRTDDVETATGMGAMTPAYASPEQVRLEPITTASDVYSLGVVLYELLSGQRPYELRGLSPADAERLVCSTEPPRPSVAIAQTPVAHRATPARRLRGDLDKIVLMAMHKDPQHRYPTAAALADDLRQFLAGRPVQARGDKLGYRLVKFAFRNRTAVGLSALLVLTAASATWNAWRQSQAVRESAQSAQQMNAFLIDVLANADPFTSGKETTLVEALYAAEAEIDLRFADKPLLEAEVRHTIGYAALSRNDLDQAERLLKRAVELRSDHLPAGQSDHAASRVAMAWLNVQRGEIKTAQSIYQQIIQEMEAADTTGDPIYVTALSDYGLLYLDHLENFNKALELFEKARALAESDDGLTPTGELSSIINNQARAEELLGRINRAIDLYAKGYKLAKEVLPPSHPNLAIYLNNRGQLTFNAGREDEGLQLLEESLAMRQANFSGDHPSVWLGMLNLATLSAKAGQLERAMVLSEQATAMARRLYPQPHLNMAISLIRGAARYQQSGNSDLVPAMIEGAIEILDQLEGNNDYWRAEITELRAALATE